MIDYGYVVAVVSSGAAWYFGGKRKWLLAALYLLGAFTNALAAYKAGIR